MVEVAVVQCELPRRAGGAALRSADHIELLVRRAADAGAVLVVLPELWRTGPFELDTTLAGALEIDHPETVSYTHLRAHET